MATTVRLLDEYKNIEEDLETIKLLAKGKAVVTHEDLKKHTKEVLATNLVLLWSRLQSVSPMIKKSAGRIEELQIKLLTNYDEKLKQLAIFVEKIDVQNSMKPNHNIEQMEKITKDQTENLAKLESLKDSLGASKSSIIPDWSKINFDEKIENVVKSSIRTELKQSKDIDSKKCNIVLFGVDDLENIEDILEVVDVKVKNIRRKFILGKGSTAPVKVELDSRDVALLALKNAHKLKKDSRFNHVYLSKDRTQEEQKQHKILVEKLKENIRSCPTKRWIIRNSEVIELEPEIVYTLPDLQNNDEIQSEPVIANIGDPNIANMTFTLD